MIRDNELAGLALTLSRDTQMKITIGGDSSSCSADGSQINIARMPATPLGRLLMTGLVFHEVAHKHHTKGNRPTGLLGELTNIIEDVRVEALLIRDRPGTSFDLEAVTNYYVQKGNLAPRDLPCALLGLVMAHGRTEILGQHALGALLAPCRKRLAVAFGAPWVREVEQMLEAEFPRLTSTNEAQRLAEALIGKLRETPDPNPPPAGRITGQEKGSQGGKQEEASAEQESGARPMDQDEEDGNGDEEGDEEGEEESKAGEAGEDPAKTNGLATRSDSSAQQGSGGKSSSQQAEQNAPSPQPPTESEIEQMLLTGTGGYGDLSAMVTQELTDLAAQTPQHLRHGIPLLPKVGRRRASPNKLDETHALAACSRMRSRLLTLLQAETLQPRHYGSSGRKLVGKRLVRMALGDARIFTRRVETRALSTAVVILLDTSGSMFDECAGVLKRFEIANPAAYALHVALKGLPGVVAASAAFATPSRHQPSVNILVDFAEAPQSNAFNIQPDGGTPTHDALWYARAALLQRPESRKIILLLTDGYPMNGEETLAATRGCEKDGIEIAALGIESEAVSRYWKNFEVIKDVRALPQAMFMMTERSLLSQKRV
jgi:hypothetical protein